MPESYQVVKAAFKKQVAKRDGKGFMHVYTYLLDPLNGGQAKDAEEFVHSSESMFKEGDHVEGTLTPGNYGRDDFTRANKTGPPAPAPTPSAGGTFRPMDPNREASIIRQHSQQMAIMWSAVLQRENKLPDTEDRGLKSLIDYFDLDVRNNAGKSE